MDLLKWTMRGRRNEIPDTQVSATQTVGVTGVSKAGWHIAKTHFFSLGDFDGNASPRVGLGSGWL
jgi:hypothetical protein